MATEKFITRHNGPRDHEIDKMLKKVGAASLDDLINQTVPESIRLKSPLDLPEAISEQEFFNEIKKIASENKVYKSYIGLGYYNTNLPAVIQRNILENPSWYTSYTPYQAEISQGRLEALLNFQTMVIELTGMEIANASLLDEATAAAEAMIMMYNNRAKNLVKNNANTILLDEELFPQTIEVIKTRALPLDIEVKVVSYKDFEFNEKVFGAVIQYPNANGEIIDYTSITSQAHAKEAMVTVATDLMSLVLLTPPSKWGADIVVGTTQRFGVPMGFGGPHAAFFATLDKFKRNMPGRIIGVSKDAQGGLALRMALQTREQHIKREKATSNICTAQALLATMAGMYAVYHGQKGLIRIAQHIHGLAGFLAVELSKLGFKQINSNYFDTLKIELPAEIDIHIIRKKALKKKINFRYFENQTIGISIDETTSLQDVNRIIKIFAKAANQPFEKIGKVEEKIYFQPSFLRKGDFMPQDVFNSYQSETEMMRYIKKLERRDISLTHSMISLGSCTMKLNAAVEMLPMSWVEFGGIHPFAPANQAIGYHFLFENLKKYLAAITGFEDVSLQPNSGAAGEYAGLLVIQEYHKSRGDNHRNVVLIPSSAHGTNPASAAMAGMDIVVVNCDTKGNIDVVDLNNKAIENKDKLSCFMVTYPSTHGVFESSIIQMCQIIHQYGGQVYMDGANMNAQVGLTNPGSIGADVCHLNLHKTFAIPHGGGGPGVGPIAVAKHLVKFLPSHPIVKSGGEEGITAVAAAPFGSASVYTISYGYIRMLGADGLTAATKMAILNANYLASALKEHYSILYTGEKGRVAHEMILDCRPLKEVSQITEADIAKRLMDFGFHAPTLSFPVHGTLMIEPTESESLQELDRFIQSMVMIHSEIMDVKNGIADAADNVLKNAPHTQKVVTSDDWNHKYSRQKAAFPLKWIADNKFWPFVSRLDDAYGDRNLFCSCSPVDEYRKTLND